MESKNLAKVVWVLEKNIIYNVIEWEKCKGRDKNLDKIIREEEVNKVL